MRNKHTGDSFCQLYGRAGQTVYLSLRPEREKRLHAAHLRQPVRSVAVVHGEDAAGLQGVAHRFCPGGVQCLGQLLRRQRMAQIAQMGHGDAIGSEDPDGVAAPERSAPVIME